MVRTSIKARSTVDALVDLTLFGSISSDHGVDHYFQSYNITDLSMSTKTCCLHIPSGRIRGARPWIQWWEQGIISHSLIDAQVNWKESSTTSTIPNYTRLHATSPWTWIKNCNSSVGDPSRAPSCAEQLPRAGRPLLPGLILTFISADRWLREKVISPLLVNCCERIGMVTEGDIFPWETLCFKMYLQKA